MARFYDRSGSPPAPAILVSTAHQIVSQVARLLATLFVQLSVVGS
ncbi:MAG TPA: hypothetical protein VH987_09975 [Candidatus Limnocylindria bacterium]|jgi:hypothetical protein